MHVSAWVIYPLAVVVSFFGWYFYDKAINDEKEVSFGFRYATTLIPIALPIIAVRIVIDVLCVIEDKLGEWYSKSTGKRVRL